MPELVGECLIKFCRSQLEIICVWVVDSILKSPVQNGCCRNDLSGRRIERTLKSESDDFRRQTQSIKNGSVSIEHDWTLSSAVAGIGIRRLAGNIACHSQEVRNRLHVAVCRKAPHCKKSARVGQGQVSRGYGGPIRKQAIHARDTCCIVDHYSSAIRLLA